MKISGLVYVGILISPIQAVLGHDLVRGVANKESNAAETGSEQDDLRLNNRDWHHRRVKKAGGGGGGGGKNKSVKKNPCKDSNTYIAAYQSIVDQCTNVDASITTGFNALDTQVGQYCSLLYLPQYTPPDATFGQNMGQLVTDYCKPLFDQAAQADYAYSSILSRENSISSLLAQLNSLESQMTSLINQCAPTGVIPAGLDSVPYICEGVPLPYDFGTGCP